MIPLYQYRLSLIRNAAALTVLVTNQNGEVLYTGNVAAQAGSAYYHVNNQTWMDTVGTLYHQPEGLLPGGSGGRRDHGPGGCRAGIFMRRQESCGAKTWWHCCNRASWVQAPALPPP